MSKAVLVLGATGQQGSAVITNLLADGSDFKLLAVTRNANSASAKGLASKSPRISIVEGDLADTEALFTAAGKAAGGPVWGAFSVQTLGGKDASGVPLEEVQGKALVDSAIKHGVKHFVYTSVDRHGSRSLENPTDIPHFITKHNIEKHLIDRAKGAGMSWTILRPVAFMDNLNGGFLGKIFATGWRDRVTARPLQLIAVDDIGVFAAKALLEPEAFSGKALSLAGDELTFEGLDRVHREKTGAPVPTTWGFIATVIVWIAADLRTMLRFFDQEGYEADIPELKKIHPGLKDLGTWLEQGQAKKRA